MYTFLETVLVEASEASILTAFVVVISQKVFATHEIARTVVVVFVQTAKTFLIHIACIARVTNQRAINSRTFLVAILFKPSEAPRRATGV